MKNWRYQRDGKIIFELNPWVFGISISLIFGIVVASITLVDELTTGFANMQAWIANNAGWFFILVSNLILTFMIYIALSRFSQIRLGGEKAVPEFSRLGWFAMLFSAGMGIGLLFYSVAEPIYHLMSPPHGAESFSVAAAEDAMATTFLHWGLHAWAIYALVGLALAYFAFNQKQPLSIRAVFAPILGERIHGFWGHTIDILATVATLFGVATSLGLGVSQINAGLNHIFGIAESTTVQIILIFVITGIATLSVVAGLDRGIKLLSEINMVGAIILVTFVLLVGPTLYILNGFVENIGNYLDRFFYLGFWNETYTGGSWQNGWTVFYWGWWIAWSPFVGMFIARISKGRTIREFVIGVMLVPTLITFLWLSVFGNSAMFIELVADGGIAKAVDANLSRSLFVFFDQLSTVIGSVPVALLTVMSVLAVLVIVTFFVTSSDSGSLVIDMITAGGNPNPPVAQRVFWATTEGIVAAILLVVGGLTALQTMAIATGLPFAAVLLLMCFSLHRALTIDYENNVSIQT